MKGCGKARQPVRPRGVVAAGLLAFVLLTLTGCPWEKPPKPEASTGHATVAHQGTG
jgi:hypothetical protein